MGGPGSGRRPSPPPSPCGTQAKYQWHRRRGQNCEACKAAHAADKRSKRKPKFKRAPRPERKTKAKAFVIAEKIKRGACMDCGLKVTEDNTFVFDFDHRDPNQKSFTISSKSGDIGIETIRQEIEKCDLVCANCHRYRTKAQYQAKVLTGFKANRQKEQLTLFENN